MCIGKNVLSYLLCVVIVPIVSLFGCSSTYDYIFVIKNVRSGGFCEIFTQSESGLKFQIDVAAKSLKSYDGVFDNPPNDLYLITWVNETGNKYSAEADLKKLLPKRFNGHIYFIIDEQHNLTYCASQEYLGEMMFKKTTKGLKVKK